MTSSEETGRAWGAEALDWANRQEPFSLPLWEAMLDMTNVGDGTRLLDAGCGAGGACRMALDRGAKAFGLDASENLLEVARERMPAGDFRYGDLEKLPYEDGSFDAVIAVNSIQFAESPADVIGEFARVCAPGGRISVAVFGQRDQVEENLVFEEIKKILPSQEGEPGEFNLSCPGKLESMMESKGLRVVGAGEVGTPFIYHNIEAAWRAQRSAGSIQEAIKAVVKAMTSKDPAAAEVAVKAAAIKGFEKFVKKSGEVRIEVAMRYVTATW